MDKVGEEVLIKTEVLGERLASTKTEKAHTRQSGSNKGKLDRQVQPHQPPICCPECSSAKLWKDGLRYTGSGQVQRWLCRDCGFRFSESTSELQVKVNVSGKASEGVKHVLDPGDVHSASFVSGKERLNDGSLPLSEDVGSHDGSRIILIARKLLNTSHPPSKDYRVCAKENEAKNLDHATEQKKETVAGTSPLDQQTLKGKLLEFEFWMQKQGYKPLTAKLRSKMIAALAKSGADLLNPESVKATLSRQSTWCDGTKAIAVVAYNSFLEMTGLNWKPPRYRTTSALPFIPLESEIDALINSCGKKMACFLQGSKDTGTDPGELAQLEWTDINTEAKSVTIRHTVKRHDSRVITVSDKFLRMLNAMPKQGSRIFCDVRSLESGLANQRRTAVRKLGNPRLLKINFRTLRHWKGTMEYHKTKDILHVKRILGHKNIKNTMIYINLEGAFFQAESDEFTARVARSLDEACKLVEAGFDYVTDIEGGSIFKRRK